MFNIGPIELLVIACLFGVWAVRVARRKGLPWPARFFLIGALFPVLGVIVIAALPSRTDVSPAAGAGRSSVR